MRKLLCLLFLLLMLPALCACGTQPAVQESAEPAPAQTPAPSLAPEPTPEPSPTPELTPEPEAEELAISVVCRGRSCDELTDGSHETYHDYWAGEAMTVAAEEPIAALYVEWENEPGVWTLEAGSHALAGGANDFMHEYFALPEPVRELTLRLPEHGTPSLAEIRAFSAGARPDWVQDWQPPCERADLLVLPTHSDDEFVFMGGLIPSYVARGMRVQVCYIVRHKGYRFHEMLDSLWEAGVRNYPITSGIGDLRRLTYEEVEQFYGKEYMPGYVVEQLRRFKPQVVVGHAEDGDSGHLTHIFGVECLKRALELSSDPEKYPDSAERWGVWDVPKAYLHLYGDAEKMVTLDYETPLEAFGGRTAFEVACDAFERCVSQYAIGHYQVYGADSVHDTHKFGLYRSLVGEDEALDDLFEHIELPG